MNKKQITLYSVLAIVVLLVGAYASGIFTSQGESSEKPAGKIAGDRCSSEYMPVCGVNGITYGNACMAQEVGVAYEGQCLVADPNAACTMDYSPVCGVDGKTYSNTCVAEKGSGVKVAYMGECSSASGTYPAGEVPENASDEELSNS